MIRRHLTIIMSLFPLVLTGLLYMIFQSTDPATIGPGGVLGVFILIYLVFLSIIFVLFRFGLYWVTKFLAKKQTLGVKRAIGVSQKKAYYIATVLAFMPVTLLAMRAFSRVQWMDLGLVMLLAVLAIFYIIKRQ